ncbi:MAG: hypothetical protein DRI71_11810 [Bacteroidetes bacterium]|nr:MAG: hypothetical protein DRI71_11810 [Bacteroidota bacterium]
MGRVSKSKMLAREHEAVISENNKLQNEIFKLHKFLIEHSASNHTIDSKDAISDAIELIIKLTRK